MWAAAATASAAAAAAAAARLPLPSHALPPCMCAECPSAHCRPQLRWIVTCSKSMRGATSEEAAVVVPAHRRTRTKRSSADAAGHAPLAGRDSSRSDAGGLSATPRLRSVGPSTWLRPVRSSHERSLTSSDGWRGEIDEEAGAGGRRLATTRRSTSDTRVSPCTPSIMHRLLSCAATTRTWRGGSTATAASSGCATSTRSAASAPAGPCPFASAPSARRTGIPSGGDAMKRAADVRFGTSARQ